MTSAGYNRRVKRKTLSLAKNLMRRALADVIDPPPSEASQAALRKHFDNRCAYCGAAAGPREGHIDHATSGRGNGLDNLLLACRTCNGDEKREMDWEAFLRLKCVETAVLEARRERILAWQGLHPAEVRTLGPAVMAAKANAERAIAEFGSAYEALRRAVADEKARRQ